VAHRRRDELHGMEYGHFLVLNLLTGPLTRDEILDRFVLIGAHLGVSLPIRSTERRREMERGVDRDLGQLSEMGLLMLDEQGAYHLTERGREEAVKTEQGLEKVASRVRAFTSSAETASKVSIAVNVLLTALKLSVGLLVNSVALLADGIDNLMDIVSAVAVFLGIRFNRELYSTAFIVVVMFGTALWIVYESVSRLIHPEPIGAGTLMIAAAVLSGVVCYAMSVYQHMVGKRPGSLSLISQSVDSRNHVFYAVAVLVGIVFARFGIFIVDSVVGLGVALVILKSGYDLAVETLKMARGKEVDFSAFGREYEKPLVKRRHNYFRSWTLVTLRDVHTREEIVTRFTSTFATDDLPIVSHFGLSLWRGFDVEGRLDSLLEELVQGGVVAVRDGEYHLTTRGRWELSRKLWYERYMRMPDEPG